MRTRKKQLVQLLIVLMIIMTAAGCGAKKEAPAGEVSEDILTRSADSEKSGAEAVGETAAEIKEKADAQKAAAEDLKRNHNSDVTHTDEDAASQEGGTAEASGEDGSLTDDEAAAQQGAEALAESGMTQAEAVAAASDAQEAAEASGAAQQSRDPILDRPAGQVFSQNSDLKKEAEASVGMELTELETKIGEPISFMEKNTTAGSIRSAMAVYEGFVVNCERRMGSQKWKIVSVN